MTKYWLPAGLVSLASLLAYFYLIGQGQWFTLLQFAGGILLVFAELLLPTLGLLALAGGLLIFLALQAVTPSWQAASFDLMVASLVAVLTFYILVKLGYRLPITNRLVLKHSLGQAQAKMAEQNELKSLLGCQAQVYSDLRPVGKIILADGQVLEARSQADMLVTGQRVIIIAIENGQLIVRGDH
ncbi:hypothetical protein AWM75_02535 [Aerococcus urinaehominis]|uniref:Uncharacterized protein n=1 Tax=Aerococcus urinaehominis TaxID=128944 RepID=A0A0X8FKF0_9LACT|nr:NfeD family protein [Aerococcus urinaehominis]AMB98940.1 hypothetical protein AWM75_02535 [Aerococcus urinaehominis]SDM40514.1 NfeD-like C-terminal, partner-binding [Aerococcus urinaehominis]